MRVSATLVAIPFALCSCKARDEHGRPEALALEPLARALAEAWPRSTHDLRFLNGSRK